MMEMMTGGDLEYYLVRKGRFAEQLARFYCAEVLLALKYLHEHGIVHRDVKVCACRHGGAVVTMHACCPPCS